MVHDQFWKNEFLTHFYPVFVQKNGPFSRHFGILHAAKRVTTCSKLAKKHLFEHPEWLETTFGKMNFDLFLAIFASQNGPF